MQRRRRWRSRGSTFLRRKNRNLKVKRDHKSDLFIFFKAMLQNIPVDQLIPYERNNKIHTEEQVKKIAKSIKELWFRAPILVDENFVILAGHWRLAAAQKLKMKEVPVIQYTDLTEEQKKKYRLLDNRLSDLSEYDLENLRIELQELNDERLNGLFEEFDLKLEEEEWNEEIEDEAPLPPEITEIQEWDIFVMEWKAGHHYLICGDSTKTETYEKLVTLAGKKADLLFTDPPYNVNYKGQGKKTSNGILNDRMSDQNFLFFLQDTFHALTTALKPTAPMYIFHASKTQREFQNAMEENGIEIISQLIWNKPSINHVWASYKSKHEPFFYAKLKGQEIPRYWSELYEETVRESPDRTQKTEKEILKVLKKAKEAEKEGLTTIRTQKRHPVQDYEHPTQKPVELVERAILNSSREWELVLEPFAGSGTTLIASEKTGRLSLNIELDPKYVEVILKRYKRITGNSIRCLNRDLNF